MAGISSSKDSRSQRGRTLASNLLSARKYRKVVQLVHEHGERLVNNSDQGSEHVASLVNAGCYKRSCAEVARCINNAQ